MTPSETQFTACTSRELCSVTLQPCDCSGPCALIVQAKGLPAYVPPFLPEGCEARRLPVAGEAA